MDDVLKVCFLQLGFEGQRITPSRETSQRPYNVSVSVQAYRARFRALIIREHAHYQGGRVISNESIVLPQKAQSKSCIWSYETILDR